MFCLLFELSHVKSHVPSTNTPGMHHSSCMCVCASSSLQDRVFVVGHLTRVSKVGSTLLTGRVEPGLRGVKVGYKRIVDHDQVIWRPVSMFGATKKLQLC